MPIIAVISIMIFTYVVGYLVSVGTLWAIQSLANAVFSTSFSIDLWLGGVLFYVIWLLLKR